MPDARFDAGVRDAKYRDNLVPFTIANRVTVLCTAYEKQTICVTQRREPKSVCEFARHFAQNKGTNAF